MLQTNNATEKVAANHTMMSFLANSVVLLSAGLLVGILVEL